MVATASRGSSSVRCNLRRARADLEKEPALVRRLASAQVFDLDRIGWHLSLVVEDFDLDQMRAPHLRAGRQAPSNRQLPQAELAQHARDDDQREQHTEQQVKEIVAGVDRGDADAQRDADEVLALAGELEPSRGT